MKVVESKTLGQADGCIGRQSCKNVELHALSSVKLRALSEVKQAISGGWVSTRQCFVRHDA